MALEHGCRNDATCSDCNDDLDHIRANKCGACEFCDDLSSTDDDDANSTHKHKHAGHNRTHANFAKNRSPLGLPCCPFPDPNPPIRVKVQGSTSAPPTTGGRCSVFDDDDGEDETLGGCRPRVGCSCQACADDCDIEFDDDDDGGYNYKLGYNYNGQPDNILSGLALPQCSPINSNPTVDAHFCKKLVDGACRLRAESPIGAVIDPHEILNASELCAQQIYVPQQFDIYAIYATERQVTIDIVARVSADVAAQQLVGDLVYLIDATGRCGAPFVIEPTLVNVTSNHTDHHTGLLKQTSEFTFLVPKQGDYLVVYSLYEYNVNGTTDVTEVDRLALQCKHYQIGVSYSAPQCPAKLCDIHNFCFGPRDCNGTTASCYACATQFGRCIQSAPFHDRFDVSGDGQFENELPSSMHSRLISDDDDNDDDNDDRGHGLYSQPSTNKHRKSHDDDDDKEDDADDDDNNSRRRHKNHNGPPICQSVKSGTPCIGTKLVGNSTVCVLGSCPKSSRGHDSNNTCNITGGMSFDCDCSCPSLCQSDRDCNDGNPRTADTCLPSGVCISRPILSAPVPPPPSPPSPPSLLESVCGNFADTVDTAVIVANCSTSRKFAGVCSIVLFDGEEVECQSQISQNGSTSADNNNTLIQTFCDSKDNKCTDTGTGHCTCLPGNQTLCQRSLDGATFTFECFAPANASNNSSGNSNSSSSSQSSVRAHLLAASLSSECVMKALDAAELAYTASAFDVFGSYDPADASAVVPPLCGANVEEGDVRVSVSEHAARLPECCTVNIDLEHVCLDGASSQTASGHQWFDRAWIALDAGTRAAQARSSRVAVEQACCASLYYAALGAWCGRADDEADFWRLRAAGRVDRGLEVGAECAAFDDGHRDRDLNEFVAEQRVVSIYRDEQLVAFNVHVLPLARGGGYTVSYALSLSGTTLEAVDRGPTAACSERARAVLKETYDQAAVSAALGAREPLPMGTVVAVMRHSLKDGPLPNGVRDSDCMALGDAAQFGAQCTAQASGTVVLFADIRATLPLIKADATDALYAHEVRFDQSTNTRRGTRALKPLFAASAIIMVPRGASRPPPRESVLFVLQNRDCGCAVLLPPFLATGTTEPQAVRVPAHSCPAFRWATEGVALVQNARGKERVCRGGSESGIAQCSDGTEGVCTTTGGECAESPVVEGVPYANAFAHFACQKCATEVACATSECAGDRCCTEEILHWYRYPNIELVYVPAQVNLATRTSAANEKK